MVAAGSKVISFTGKQEQWQDEKSAFLALCGASGVKKILDGTYVVQTLPPNFDEFDEERQEDWVEKVAKSVEKAEDKRECAWNLLHQAARTYFKSIIQDHERVATDTRVQDAWTAIVNQMEGRNQQEKQAMHYERFRFLKMSETSDRDPALDFDNFVSNINSAQRSATEVGAPFTPVQIFDQLKQGIPRKYLKELVNDITAGNNTMETLVPVFRLRLTTEYNIGLRSGSSAAAQAEAHARNEKSTVQSLLASVLAQRS